MQPSLRIKRRSARQGQWFYLTMSLSNRLKSFAHNLMYQNQFWKKAENLRKPNNSYRKKIIWHKHPMITRIRIRQRVLNLSQRTQKQSARLKSDSRLSLLMVVKLQLVGLWPSQISTSLQMRHSTTPKLFHRLVVKQMTISPASGSAWVSERKAQLVDQRLKCQTIQALSRRRNNSRRQLQQPCHPRISLIPIVAKQSSQATITIWRESRQRLTRLPEATSNSALQMWAKTSALACRLFPSRPVLQAIWTHSKCQRPQLLNSRIQRTQQSLKKASRVQAQIVNSVVPRVPSSKLLLLLLLLRMRLKVAAHYQSRQVKWQSKRHSLSQCSN